MAESPDKPRRPRRKADGKVAADTQPVVDAPVVPVLEEPQAEAKFQGPPPLPERETPEEFSGILNPPAARGPIDMNEIVARMTPPPDLRAPAPPVEVRRPAAPPPEPVQLPRNVLDQVDCILHHPENVLESIRRDHDLWLLTRSLFLIGALLAAGYGVIMGATNWLQGDAFPFTWDLVIMIVTGIKVPFLLFLTMAIVLPPIYVSSTFLGSRASFSQVTCLIIASMTIMTLALASMGTVAFFFSLTTKSYDFIKLMHVAIFAYAGLVGLGYLARGFERIVGATLGRRKNLIFVGWLLLYGFVGMQLAWELRPFIGNPGMRYTLFRPHEMSFYESVWGSFTGLFDDEDEKGGDDGNKRGRPRPLPEAVPNAGGGVQPSGRRKLAGHRRAPQRGVALAVPYARNDGVLPDRATHGGVPAGGPALRRGLGRPAG